jgi:hypothetical protein
MIQIKLVGMFIIFTVLNFICLSAMIHELVFSIKDNVNFNFQPSVMFVLLVSQKMVFLKLVHPLKTYKHTKCHGPMLTGTSFASS